MSPDYTDAQRIIALGTGYQAGRLVIAALESGIFDRLATEPNTAPALADTLGLNKDALERMLHALCACGLLSCRRSVYRLKPDARRYLCSGRPGYLGHYLLHAEGLYSQWSRLAGTIKTGRMCDPEPGRIADYRRHLILFLRAMDALGRLKAPEVLRPFSAGTCTTMLDIGGGLGTFARCFVQRRRTRRAVVFDLPDVTAHTRRAVRSDGLAKLIGVTAGHYLQDPLPPGPHDLVLLSNLLHIYPPDDCMRMISTAAEVLAPGGTLLIHDYIFGCGDARTVALFDITMLTGTPLGRCPEKKQLHAWLSRTGLHSVRSANIPGGSAIMWARKADCSATP